MRIAVSAMISTLIILGGTAAFSQTVNLQNPGTSTTPGVRQPTQPGGTQATSTFQNIQSIQVGPTTGPQSQLPPLQFSSINVSAPAVIPNRFGTVNVLTTMSPAATVAQPLPSASTGTTSSNSISPAMASFTFTPSQQFIPVQAPSAFRPPSQTPFVAK